MPNYKRYKVATEWRHDHDHHPGDPRIRIEVADLLDKQTGTTYHEGAHRVVSDGYRTKVFFGETAWSDAERAANDLYWSRRNAS